MLHEFIGLHRDEILQRCRAKAATRSEPSTAVVASVHHGVPVFLDQLAVALRDRQQSSPGLSETASHHGYDLLRQGFTVSEVVHHYGDVCQAITELAIDLNMPIATDDFRVLNRCLDDAIAGAVAEHGREGTQVTLDEATARESERLGFFVHELRNLLDTTMLAFQLLKTGNVGVGGSTGTVLHRSLAGAIELVSRSFAEVRLERRMQQRKPFLVAGFIEDLAATATLAAQTHRVTLATKPVEEGVVITADRQVLTAALMNLLDNAFKFTRPGSTVTLSAEASAERVTIAVEDECGGLPDGSVDDLFRSFEQRSADRSGLGLGLAFSRWGVEANQGRIHARTLPSKGCVFSVDLPRLATESVPL